MHQKLWGPKLYKLWITTCKCAFTLYHFIYCNQQLKGTPDLSTHTLLGWWPVAAEVTRSDFWIGWLTRILPCCRSTSMIESKKPWKSAFSNKRVCLQIRFEFHLKIYMSSLRFFHKVQTLMRQLLCNPLEAAPYWKIDMPSLNPTQNGRLRFQPVQVRKRPGAAKKPFAPNLTYGSTTICFRTASWVCSQF